MTNKPSYPLLRNDVPLYMPPGSVRSLLAFLVTGGYLFGIVSEDVLIIVLGFYFISRNQEGDQASKIEKTTDTGDIL